MLECKREVDSLGCQQLWESNGKHANIHSTGFSVEKQSKVNGYSIEIR